MIREWPGPAPYRILRGCFEKVCAHHSPSSASAWARAPTMKGELGAGAGANNFHKQVLPPMADPREAA